MEERKRERERKKDTEPQALVVQRWFNISVSIYRLLYKKFLSIMIKIRKPNVQQLLPREKGLVKVTRSGDNPYLKKKD